MSSPPLPATALTSWRLACGPPVLTVEFVPLAEGVGRILARPLDALCDSPAHEAAAMDGIAVRARDTVALRLPAGSYDLVDTGDAIPAGRDAVVVREQVSFRPDGIGGAECAVLAAAVPVGRHVRTVGEDVRTGELLLDAGLRLRPVDLALAAAGGHTGLPVLRRPHVVVIPTGDEVLPLGSRPGPGQVLDTNSLMLVAQAGEAGCTAVASPVVPDQPAALTEAVRQAARTADLVVVIAGSSAGRDDHTASVVATAGTLVVHGVAVRPGHPVVLGVVDATPVLGAPGYPVSAALSFELFAIPLLADLAGTTARQRARRTARLAADLSSPLAVDDWVRVRLDGDLATPLPGGAGGLAILAHADGLLLVPAGVAGHAGGDLVSLELLDRT